MLLHAVSLGSTSNGASTLSLSSNWPTDCLVSSGLQQKDMTCIQVRLSADLKALVFLWVGLGPPGWPGLPPVVSFRETYLAQSYGLALKLLIPLSAQSGLTFTSGHPLMLSLAPVAGTTDTGASLTCGPCSHCWQHRHADPCDPPPLVSRNTCVRNRGPLFWEWS